MPTLREDRETIVSFEWVDYDTDDAPLPVDPDDPDQLRCAIRWATRTYNALDHEYFMAQHSTGYPPDAEPTYLADRNAMGLFRAALIRTYQALRKQDEERLRAWVDGEPIRVEV